MKIDNQTIHKIAHLARLKVKPEDEEQLVKDMNRILGFMDKLNELDTSNVEPLVYLSVAAEPLRNDEVKKEISREEALLNAPASDGRYFKVPKVIKK